MHFEDFPIETETGQVRGEAEFSIYRNHGCTVADLVSYKIGLRHFSRQELTTIIGDAEVDAIEERVATHIEEHPADYLEDAE